MGHCPKVGAFALAAKNFNLPSSPPAHNLDVATWPTLASSRAPIHTTRAVDMELRSAHFHKIQWGQRPLVSGSSEAPVKAREERRRNSWVPVSLPPEELQTFSSTPCGLFQRGELLTTRPDLSRGGRGSMGGDVSFPPLACSQRTLGC